MVHMRTIKPKHASRKGNRIKHTCSLLFAVLMGFALSLTFAGSSFQTRCGSAVQTDTIIVAKDTQLTTVENPGGEIHRMPSNVVRWPQTLKTYNGPPSDAHPAFVDELSKRGVPNAMLYSLINGTVYVYPENAMKDGFNANLVRTMTTALQRVCTERNVTLRNLDAPFVAVADPGLLPGGSFYLSGWFTYCRRLQMPGLRTMVRPYFVSRDLGKSDTTPWKDKVARAVFRGSLSSEARLNLYLAHRHSPELQDLLDFGITKIPAGAPAYANNSEYKIRWCANCPEKWSAAQGIPIVDRMEMPAQQRFKYVVSVDGAGCADRLGHLLSGKFVVLRQETPLYEHYYGLLVPYVHYVPVRADFSDLAEKIKWLQAHDDIAVQIVQEANHFAELHLSQNGILDAWLEFASVAASLSSPTKPSTNAVKYKEFSCPQQKTPQLF